MMKKRVTFDLFLEDITQEEMSFLIALKNRSVDISDTEKSTATVHDCGHDDGKQCVNEVNL